MAPPAPVTRSGRRRRSAAVPTLSYQLSYKGILGEAASVAAKTDTFLGERYRRIVKRRGKPKALVAVARSILVIVWHLLADPTTRFQDLGSDYHAKITNTAAKKRNHIHQLEALGYIVTLTPAEAAQLPSPTQKPPDTTSRGLDNPRPQTLSFPGQ